MCGIAGLMAVGGMATDDAALTRMAEAMAHRGPDGRGRYAARDVALAHNRLSIIDLDTGSQPIDDGERAAIVANAEIYNYIELCEGMEAENFTTRSDCELPLRLYPTAGTDIVRQLRGMYAIALHDRREDSLLLARDPFGIKPLYYVESSTGLAFASEPRALIAGGFAAADLEPRAQSELLAMQFTTGRDSIYRDIKRVLPGETILARAGRVVERHRLEALPLEPPAKEQSVDEALNRLDSALMDSVMVHQRADVPYGMFLSGGVDSAVLLAAMARHSERPVHAFTAGFSGGEVHDERNHARTVASAVGAEHVEVEFGEEDFIELLPKVVAALDDPVADYATLPTYKLGQSAAAEGLKVVLCGEGGDELFAGYGRYRSATRSWWKGGGKAMRARSVLERFDLLREPSLGWREGISAVEHLVGSKGLTPLQQVQAVDCAEWLPNDLLIKLDRCLMAHGVEGRTPLLDSAVAKVAFALPDVLKLRGSVGKWLLRKWLDTYLPQADAFAHKRGFTVPVGSWILRHATKLGPLVASQPGVAEWCLPEQVRRIFKQNGKHEKFAAWILLFYALWHQVHVLGHAYDGNLFDCLEP